MPTNILTDKACREAAPAQAGYRLPDGGGLVLFVTPAGGKVWRLRYRTSDGREQTHVIGQYPSISLAQARAERDRLKARLALGQPIKQEPAPTAATVETVCRRYWQGRGDITEAYRMNVLNALERYIFPRLGERPVAELSRAECLQALKVMEEGGRLDYLRKVRLWLSMPLDQAVELEQASINPVRLIDTKRAFAHHKKGHFAALELTEVPAFVKRLQFEGELPSAQAAWLLMLTWARTKELRMMQWDQIDGDLWRVPADMMKKERDHVVPLSRQAREILAKLERRHPGGPYVFPNGRTLDRPISENAVLYLLHRMGYKGRLTGHGFRSIGSTWANERGYHDDAVERQLSHAPADKVRAAYNRAKYLDERRRMMQDFADWITSLKDEEPLPSPASSEASTESAW